MVFHLPTVQGVLFLIISWFFVSATHEKANACISSNFLLLLSCPILNCCLGNSFCHPGVVKRRWITLFCARNPSTTTNFIIFLLSTYLVPSSVAGTMAEAKKGQLESGPQHCAMGAIQLQSSMICERHMRQKGKKKNFLKLSCPFLGDTQWKTSRVKPSRLEAWSPLSCPFSASDCPSALPARAAFLTCHAPLQHSPFPHTDGRATQGKEWDERCAQRAADCLGVSPTLICFWCLL